MPKQVHLIVRGHVQGVFFRAATQHEARRLGLAGWVRNLGDGSVEILAQGESSALAELVTWSQHGPAGAWVERVDEEWGEADGQDPDFRIRH